LKNYSPENYKAFVLGCTHFNYFKAYYKRIFPDTVQLVDGNAGTIRQLMRKLGIRKEKDPFEKEGNGRIQYYFSGKPVTKEEKKRIETYIEQLDILE